jgi:hypothetical protein
MLGSLLNKNILKKTKFHIFIHKHKTITKMTFEQESNQYLEQLETEGVIIEGNLIGVSEHKQISKAIVAIDINGSIEEKHIIITKRDGIWNWNFINPIDRMEYDHGFTDDDSWHYETFTMRIVAPVELLLEYPQFEVWFRLNNMPVVNKNGTIYGYCNFIIPEHQALVDGLGGVITIEYKDGETPISGSEEPVSGSE